MPLTSDNPYFLKRFIDQDIYIISPGSARDPEDIKSAAEKGSRITFLVLDDDYTAENEELLNKILASVDLPSKDASIVRYSDLRRKDPEEVMRKTEYLISFGVKSEKSEFLSIQTMYSAATVDSTKVVMADALKDIAVDEAKKRRLWNCLKGEFVSSRN